MFLCRTVRYIEYATIFGMLCTFRFHFLNHKVTIQLSNTSLLLMCTGNDVKTQDYVVITQIWYLCSKSVCANIHYTFYVIRFNHTSN